jgi:hypothetical protein
VGAILVLKTTFDKYGWLAIRESWITIFSNTEMIRFIITNAKIRIFDNNKIAVLAS